MPDAAKTPAPVSAPPKPVTPAPPSSQPTPATPLEKARAARKKVDPNETPEKAFKRLCESRVSNLLLRIKHVKALGRFKPSEVYREKVFKTVREALTQAELSWKGNESMDDGFQL